MDQTIKNKLFVVVYALILGSMTYLLIKRQKEFWETFTIIVFAVILVLLHITNINRIKYYKIIDDALIIRHTFSKQKQYNLKAISGWTENNYQLLGIKTKREIVLTIKGESKIKLFEKNSKDFEKLSNYLNENIPEAFEK